MATKAEREEVQPMLQEMRQAVEEIAARHKVDLFWDIDYPRAHTVEIRAGFDLFHEDIPQTAFVRALSKLSLTYGQEVPHREGEEAVRIVGADLAGDLVSIQVEYQDGSRKWFYHESIEKRLGYLTGQNIPFEQPSHFRYDYYDLDGVSFGDEFPDESERIWRITSLNKTGKKYYAVAETDDPKNPGRKLFQRVDKYIIARRQEEGVRRQRDREFLERHNADLGMGTAFFQPGDHVAVIHFGLRTTGTVVKDVVGSHSTSADQYGPYNSIEVLVDGKDQPVTFAREFLRRIRA